MDFIKKYINIFVLAITIFLSCSSFAKTVESSDCGVSNNVVEYANGAICEQDVSFRLLYKMFPTVIETYVFPIVKPEYLELVPVIESDNLFKYQTQEIVLFEIFKASLVVAQTIALLFIIWHFILINLFKSADQGSFLGQDWQTSKVLGRYLIITILLMPVSSTGVLLIHVVLLSIIVLGIYFANFFWASYLHYLQVGDNMVSMNEPSVTEQKSIQEDNFNDEINKYDHNYYFAYSYAKELTKIAMCKQRTEKLLYQSILPVATTSTINDMKSCFVNDINKSSWDQDLKDKTNNKAFINFKSGVSSIDKYSNKSEGSFTNKVRLFETSKIEFGNKDFKQCESDNNKSFSGVNYECGSIKVTPINNPTERVKDVMDAIGFYDTYKSASETVMNNNAPNVTKYWETLSNRINEIYNSNPDFKDDKDEKELIMKNISFLFHQKLMNDALVGNSSYKLLNENSLQMTKESNFNLKTLSGYTTLADNVAKEIEKIGCYRNPFLYNEAVNASELINGLNTGNVLDKSYNTSCLNLDTLKPIGFNPKPIIQNDNSGNLLETTKANKEKQAMEMAQKEFEKLITEIYNKRTAIELSYFKSIVSLSSNDKVNKLRKEGWAVSGGYMLMLLSEKEADAKLLHALRNMTVVKSVLLDSKGLPPNMNYTNLLNDQTNNTLTEWFDVDKTMKELFDSKYVEPENHSLKYVDVNEFISTRLEDSLADENPNEDTLDSVLSIMFNSDKIIYGMKKVIGISSSNTLDMKNIESCINTSLNKEGYECPINLTNPIVEISKLGHDIIDTTLNVIIAAVMLAIMDRSISLATSKILSKNGTGSISKGDDKLSQDQIKKTQKSRLKYLKGFESFVGILSTLSSLLLGLATFMLTIGMTMAYVLPLIPFVAFTIAFVSWIIICLEVLIIGPIWLGFLFRIEDTNKASTELYMAGFNFVMQLLFRPALIIVSLAICWSLFSLMFFIVNITFAPLVILFSNSGGFVTGYVYSMLIILGYAIVLYVAIKMLFNLMISMPNDIFNKLSVQPFDSSYEKDSHEKLSNITMAGVGVSGIVSKALQGSLEKNKEYRAEAKSEIERQMEEFNKAEIQKNKQKLKESKEKENE